MFSMWACAVLLIAAFLLTFRVTDFPPGLHVDGAVEGFNVQEVLQGHPQAFFKPGYGAAYIYPEAAVIALLGTHRLAYSFASVAIAMLGLALSIRLAKAMFAWPVAVLSGALLATSLWFVFIGRIGVWQVTMPAATVAPLYFLWRALRFGRHRDAIAGGVALGMSQYAYFAIRFLPLTVVLLCLAELANARRRVRLLMEYVAVSLVVFLPEGLYFVLNPQVALKRPEEVHIFSPDVAETLRRIAGGLARTAGMFFVLGDWRGWQAIPYRPVFDPLLAAFFCLGLVLVLIRWRDVRSRWAVLALAGMLLPTALTADPPSFFRAFGAAPVTFVFPALAMVWLARRVRAPLAVGASLAVLLVGFEAYQTYDVYFRQWGPSNEAAVAFDAHNTPMAHFAEDHAGATIFFSDIRTLGGQPVRAMVLSTQQQGWYPEDSAAIPLPVAGDSDVLYAGSPRSAIGGLAPTWLPQVQSLQSTAPTDPHGMWAFRWPASGRSQLMSAQIPVGVDFGSDLRLSSYSVDRAAGGVGLNLLWRQLSPSGPYDLYTHVLDAFGRQVAQDDKLYFPVEVMDMKERLGEGLPTNDLVLTRFIYQLPPGRYRVEAGAVHRSPVALDQLLAPAGAPTFLEIDVP